MSKPIATAIIDQAFFGYGGEARTPITRKGAQYSFQADGWRSMAFPTIDAAKAKMASHPGFKGWAA
jgi:hypothetical protein